MTSATDELRRLLDERGVEWHDDGYPTTCTVWASNGIVWHGLWRDDCIELIAHLTPEQVIAATLGAAYEPPVAAHWDGDTLTLTIPRDPSCIRVQRSAGQPCKVYADESKVIAATLGSCNCTNSERTNGTCHMEQTGHVKIAGVDYYDDDYECSECGVELFEGYNYCPNCGRRIEQ